MYSQEPLALSYQITWVFGVPCPVSPSWLQGYAGIVLPRSTCMSKLLGNSALRECHGSHYVNQTSSAHPQEICIRLGLLVVLCQRQSLDPHLRFTFSYLLLPELCAAVSLLCNFTPAVCCLEYIGSRRLTEWHTPSIVGYWARPCTQQILGIAVWTIT